MQTHAASAGLPVWAGAVAAQTREFLPTFPAVGRAEQSSIFHPCVNGVGIGERRLEMPSSLELPGMRRAVVPSAGDPFA